MRYLLRFNSETAFGAEIFPARALNCYQANDRTRLKAVTRAPKLTQPGSQKPSQIMLPVDIALPRHLFVNPT